MKNMSLSWFSFYFYHRCTVQRFYVACLSVACMTGSPTPRLSCTRDNSHVPLGMSILITLDRKWNVMRVVIYLGTYS